MKMVDLSNTLPIVTHSHTSKGNQTKWLYKGIWYKADHMGYEALSEVVVSELLKKSNIENFVVYKPVEINYQGEMFRGCESNNFKEKDQYIIPLERLHRMTVGVGLAGTLVHKDETEARIKYTADFVEAETGLRDVGKYITILTEIDAFFLNEDRHTNNIAVIRNEKTKEFSLAPIFDNGLSVLSDIHDYPIENDVYKCITEVRAKPFNISFDEQLDAAESLYGCHLKFDFTNKDVSRILAGFKGVYHDEILRRVETVIFQQMRKYSYFF